MERKEENANKKTEKRGEKSRAQKSSRALSAFFVSHYISIFFFSSSTSFLQTLAFPHHTPRRDGPQKEED
jgi:hypothetical protein